MVDPLIVPGRGCGDSFAACWFFVVRSSKQIFADLLKGAPAARR